MEGVDPAQGSKTKCEVSGLTSVARGGVLEVGYATFPKRKKAFGQRNSWVELCR